MEIYILDSQLRRETVVDQFESLIWTERFNSAGDFELQLLSSVENRRRFKTGKWLAIRESFRCMQVATIEDDVDDEGKKILKVSGPSIELPVLENRVAFNVKDDLTTNPKWVITDQPADIARQLFNDICVTGILDVDDILPYIETFSVLPTDTYPEPTDTVTAEFEPQDLYTAIRSVCEPYDLGFRFVRNYDLSQIAFQVYSGNDRTSQQSTRPLILFSTELNNLSNTKKLETISGIKNIAYVYSNLGFEEVVATDVDPSISGFERKILMVKHDDFDAGTSAATVTAMMQQKGREELARARSFVGFDGEVTEINEYVYGEDYQLGDLVEMQDDEGAVAIVRVTEQIFVSDSNGIRSYPTLSIRANVEPGTWLAEGTETWLDYDDNPTTYWSSMP